MSKIVALMPGFSTRPGLSQIEIYSWEASSGFALPPSYHEFLQSSNGGEGPIGSYGYLILWPSQEIIANRLVTGFANYAPTLLPFGSDGGGEAFTIMTSAVEKRGEWFGYVPLADIKLENFVPISQNFWDSVILIGQGKAFDQSGSLQLE